MSEEEEYYNNSMEIGGEIHKPSDTVKKFLQLPIDLRYSFIDRIEKMTYRLRSSAYQNYEYIDKNLTISRIELMKYLQFKKSIYKIKNEEDLKALLINSGYSYNWNYIKSLPKKDRDILVDEIIKQLKEVKKYGYIEELYTDYDLFVDSLKNYNSKFSVDNDKDDIGILNDMITIEETAKAYLGKFYKNMNTTININKDVDPVADAEEEPEESETGSKGFSKFFKKRG